MTTTTTTVQIQTQGMGAIRKAAATTNANHAGKQHLTIKGKQFVSFSFISLAIVSGKI